MPATRARARSRPRKGRRRSQKPAKSTPATRPDKAGKAKARATPSPRLTKKRLAPAMHSAKPTPTRVRTKHKPHAVPPGDPVATSPAPVSAPPDPPRLPTLRPQAPVAAIASRIVTVAVRGFHGDRAPRTKKRAKLLDRIVDGLIERTCWDRLDAILLPGGFFQLKEPIGDRDHEGRIRALSKTKAGRRCAAASRHLADHRPGVALIVGLDSEPFSKSLGGDQLIAAWRNGALIGLARKAFPTSGDTDCKRPMAVHPQDYFPQGRFIELASGARALLCACYDLFGVKAAANPKAAPGIKLLLDGQARASPASREDRRLAMVAWRQTLKATTPDLALCAIHRFKRPGQEGFWQRHGLAGASAALSGAPAIGAAHFEKRLPSRIRDSPLAAADAPPNILDLGSRRPALPRRPDGGLFLFNRREQPVALIRLFNLKHRRNIS